MYPKTSEQEQSSSEGTPCLVRVSEDKMALYLDALVPEEGIGPLMLQAQEALERAGVMRPELVSKALDRMVSAAENDPALKNALLLEGYPPKPPRDAEIEWLGDYFKEGFEVDPDTGAVDYRKRLAKRSVTAGQPLARVLPPIPGEDGINALGEMVHPRPPEPLHVRAGENVLYDDTGMLFTAAADGRLALNDDVLAVQEVLVIEGCIDLGTGNINHPGTLVVNQDILNGATVAARGDLDVHGFIEGAHIIVKGNLFVKGGISQSNIEVKGEVHARIVENSTIHAYGNVFIEREMLQSQVLTKGAVLSPGARVVGGKLQALCGIEAAEFGSDACIRTEVICGEDYTLEERVAAAEAEMKTEQETLNKIVERVSPLRNREKDLPQKARDALNMLLSETEKLQKSIQTIEQNIEHMRKEVKELAVTDIRLKRALHAETFVRMRGVTLRIPKNLRGATIVGLSPKGITINSRPAIEAFRAANAS